MPFLLVIDDDSDLCRDARALGALCGCPVADIMHVPSVKVRKRSSPDRRTVAGRSLVDFENEQSTSGLALILAHFRNAWNKTV